MLNRRNFLQLAGASIAGVYLPSKHLLSSEPARNASASPEMRIVAFGAGVLEPVERLGVKPVKRFDRTFIRRAQLCFNPDESDNIFNRHKNVAHSDLFDDIRMLIGLFIGRADNLLIVQGTDGIIGTNIMKAISAYEHQALGASVFLIDHGQLSLIPEKDTCFESFCENAQRVGKLQDEPGLNAMIESDAIRKNVTIDMLSSSGISSAVMDTFFDISRRDNLEICLPNYPTDIDNLRVRG